MDELAFVGDPPMFPPEVEEIHVSCTFSYDKQKAEYLAYQWDRYKIPVKLGGPAYGQFTEEFIPGNYLKKGFVITSVGCPNKCWFCRVPKGPKELEIKEGWIVQDDNLLACSENHIKNVFEMLGRQKNHAEFRGGLEAKLLKPWHIELLQKINPKSMYFAYDTPDDYEPLLEAGKMLNEAGFTLRSRKKSAYVLIGYPKDAMEKAEKRLLDTLKAGYIPFAMLYKDKQGNENKEWRKFQRPWARPAIIYTKYREYFMEG